ncbi:glycoside hydrolase family 18 protein [Chitinophaga horti]|uniref:chitinase n=1 Tax=Chitinophaga horti TaxID=2920382 RepID=A0ABY6J6Y5_9BACT|nr:glycoside hydrolase family 18 protein [Chitinophaga horti]UYQ94022.1 glycoside hydrolase family 18 protein [Chitinophaga horti]
MRYVKTGFPIIALLLVCLAFRHEQAAPSKVIIGYVGGFRGLVDASVINAAGLTHINYAFVDVQKGRAFLTNERTDTVNFRRLVALKKINPSLQILISIGGWSWSENFSDAALTDASRKLFAHSATDIVARYQLDGVDIDWEYPGIPGEEGNVYRPEDKQNFTLMFQALRASLDSLQQRTGKRYLLTTAVGGSKSCVDHTEMDKAQQYLDYVNIMTYDYRTEGSRTTGHHTNLYPATGEANGSSAHRSIQLYLDAGVPASKIVMGIAFYGRAWQMADADNNGLLRKPKAGIRGAGFTDIKDKLLTTEGYVRHWDDSAKAPYLFHPDKKIFLSYDDESSVTQKCNYVKQHGLAGVMFWEYNSDLKGYLLSTINQQFR